MSERHRRIEMRRRLVGMEGWESLGVVAMRTSATHCPDSEPSASRAADRRRLRFGPQTAMEAMKAASDCGSLTSTLTEEDKNDKCVELLLNLRCCSSGGVSSAAQRTVFPQEKD